MTLLPPKSTRTDTLFPDTTLFRSIVAPLNLRIGGKCGPLSGDPLDLRVTVRAIVEQHSQVGLNLRYPLGIGVWLQADNDVDIVLITNVRKCWHLKPSTDSASSCSIRSWWSSSRHSTSTQTSHRSPRMLSTSVRPVRRRRRSEERR